MNSYTRKANVLAALLASSMCVTACGPSNNETVDPQPAQDMSSTDQGMDMTTPDMPADMTMPVDMPADMTEDLCADVDCSTPPAPRCDGDTAITSSAGTCDTTTGMCTYTETPTECTGDTPVCQAGTCVASEVNDPDPTCENYCDVITTNCTGDNAQYGSREECISYCEGVGGWDTGAAGDDSGNSIACRIYHGNAPAAADPAMHCNHAGPSGGNVCGSWCDVYCNLGFEHCAGPNKLYDDEAACQTACADISADGSPGDIEYDTVQCRIYHLGAPAASMPDAHCSHGAEVASDFCVGSPDDFIFSTDPPSAYTRHDRMGMPAVSTALISDKEGYNDQDPINDADPANPYVGEMVNNLTALHTALDDDLIGAGLVPCSMITSTNGLPSCVGQRVSQGGPTVASLVIPDHITIDPTLASGFPNGRLLSDPVIDVTLAIILLDMNAHTPTTLAELPLNPGSNDLGVEGAFLTTFPFLHPPHTP